ncbi:exosortase [Desulfuromonas versatilis]|uniref:Exosortase n=2 Tax=Desulfuromonas versatilis TaxID=2802975 RepID=A0ABN6DYS6_9BACT|nr:exosortase [Desulfuromonas versatilis]
MVDQWSNDPNYSHGFLVPVISIYFLLQKKAELNASPVRPSNLGLLVILGGLAMLIVGIAGTEYFTMRSSLVVLLAGIVLYLFGWQVFKILALPIGFLIFMVPLPYIVYDAAAFPLKLFVAKFSVISLKALGVIVMREGNIIMFPNTVLEVADACSGLRSLMSLIALAVAFAFMSQKTAFKKTFLILMAIPIAIFTNMVRVIVTGFLAQYYGAAAAEGFFHEFAGMAVFVLAMVLLVGTGAVLRKVGGERKA